VIVATGLEVRIGARVLLHPATFSVGPGDKVGLVGRNGAGKTTLTRILAGEGQPTSGTVSHRGSVGYLPQGPRTGDLEQLAIERILDARDLGTLTRRLREAELAMAGDDETARDAAGDRSPRREERFRAAGG